VKQFRTLAAQNCELAFKTRKRADGLRDDANESRDKATELREKAREEQDEAKAGKLKAEGKELEDRARELVGEATRLDDRAMQPVGEARELEERADRLDARAGEPNDGAKDRAEAVGSHEPDECCHWLSETVSKVPAVWGCDEVVKFEHNILGEEDMGNNMVVRECYRQLYSDHIREWLFDKKEGKLRRSGLFVITGTPGIGKTVFQGFVAAQLLSAGISIVIQRGNRWHSCKLDEGKIRATNHGKTEPTWLSDRNDHVLLGDPGGGENAAPVLPRPRGCTIVFSSTNFRNYDSAFKQAGRHHELFFMTRWSKQELTLHHNIVLPHFQSIKDIERAYDLLGGSLRWLDELSTKQAEVGIDEAAKQLIRGCIERATYASLVEAIAICPSKMETDVTNSTLSLILQIETNNSNPRKPLVKLLDSDLALNTIHDVLSQKNEEHRTMFLHSAMDKPILGSLVGKVYERHVLDHFCGKGKKPHKLKFQSLSSKVPAQVEVPNAKQDLPTLAATRNHADLGTGILYAPHADNFPATDFFFRKGEDLWLLQTTKDDEHECNIGAMCKLFQKHFKRGDLNAIESIHWVVIVPNDQIASCYYEKLQNVVGKWNLSSRASIDVKQYVSILSP